MKQRFFVLLAASICLLSGVQAFWRLQCEGITAQARIDPLISPGQVSAHVHTIKGSSAISESSTAQDLLNGKCTSCQVAEDMSAYWAPQFYFQYENGTFTAVPEVRGHLTYYKYVPVFIDGVYTMPEAIPFGFQMIAGDFRRRNFSLAEPDPPHPWTGEDATQDALRQKAVGFNCLNYQAKPEDSLYRHKLPSKDFIDANCPDGMRMELLFPQCWDGQDFAIEEIADHVWYPDALLNGGFCPKGTKKNINQIFFETIYDTSAFKGVKGTYTFSQGDTTGCGYHGDAIFAWKGDTLQKATEDCGPVTGIGASGDTSQCPHFTMVDPQAQGSCEIQDQPTALGKVNLMSSLTKLPGNNPLTFGPDPAPMMAPSGADAAPIKPEPQPVSPPTTPGGKKDGSNGGYGNVALQVVSTTTPTTTSTTISTTTSTTTTRSVTPAPAPPAGAAIKQANGGQLQVDPNAAAYTTYIKDGVQYDVEVVKQTVTVFVPPGPTPMPRAVKRDIHAHKQHMHMHHRRRRSLN